MGRELHNREESKTLLLHGTLVVGRKKSGEIKSPTNPTVFVG